MIIQSNNSQVLQKETSGLLLVRGGERTGKEGIREGIRVQSLLYWDQEKTCRNV